MSRTFAPRRPQDAFDWVDRWPLPAPSSRELPLAEAAGLVLARDLRARADVPDRARCSRDGYALSAADTLGAGDYNPLPLRLGRSPSVGTAVAVSAGDPLGDCADAVLPLELGEVFASRLEVAGTLAAGDGVVHTGEECRSGELLLPAGRRLRPQDLAWLALSGLERVEVRRRPRVCIVSAGRFETDADAPMLASLAVRDGGDPAAPTVARDSEGLTTALGRADADLVLVAGGSGYGVHDTTVAALEACGELHLDGVAIHPGGGVVLGAVGQTPAVLLPGTPLACLCAYDLLVARLLRRLAGRPGALPYRRLRLPLGRKVVSSIGRLELARMRVHGGLAEPLAVAEDRLLASAVHADGFLLVPENSEGYAEGTPVDLYLYDAYD